MIIRDPAVSVGTLGICIGTSSGSAESGLRRNDDRIQDLRKVDWVQELLGIQWIRYRYKEGWEEITGADNANPGYEVQKERLWSGLQNLHVAAPISKKQMEEILGTAIRYGHPVDCNQV